jgi:hypothetical protein
MFYSEDTPLHIKEIQKAIMYRKTESERFEQGIQFIGQMHEVRINRYKLAHPDLSHEQIIILMMRDMRQKDEQLAWLDTIGVWEKLPVYLQIKPSI